MGLTGLNQGFGRTAFLSGRSREGSVFLPFPASGGPALLGTRPSSSIFKASNVGQKAQLN